MKKQPRTQKSAPGASGPKPRLAAGASQITADAIIRIVRGEPRAVKAFRLADRRAAAFLKSERNSAMMTAESEHHDVFDGIAKAADPKLVKKLDALLDAFDGHHSEDGEIHWACDVACDRWTPNIEAAYYFGLALGLRLAGGVR